MSKIGSALKETFVTRGVYDEIRVTHLISFKCCVFCFVCQRSMSCMSNVAGFSGLFILDCPFGLF